MVYLPASKLQILGEKSTSEDPGVIPSLWDADLVPPLAAAAFRLPNRVRRRRAVADQLLGTNLWSNCQLNQMAAGPQPSTLNQRSLTVKMTNSAYWLFISQY